MNGTLACEQCGAPRPNVSYLWGCCGDGPGLSGEVKPERLACVERQLTAASLLASEQRERAEKAEAARDGSQAALVVALREKREAEIKASAYESAAAVQARKLAFTLKGNVGLSAQLRSERAGRERLVRDIRHCVETWRNEAGRLPDGHGQRVYQACADRTEAAIEECYPTPAPPSEAPLEPTHRKHLNDLKLQIARLVGRVYEADGHNDAPADWCAIVERIEELVEHERAWVDSLAPSEAQGGKGEPSREELHVAANRAIAALRSQPTLTGEAKDWHPWQPSPMHLCGACEKPFREHNTGYAHRADLPCGLTDRGFFRTTEEGEPKPARRWCAKCPHLLSQHEKGFCKICECGGYLNPTEPPPASPPASDADGELKVGQRVTVTAGDLTGWVGEIEEFEAGRTWPYAVAFADGYVRRFVAESLKADPSPPLPVELGPVDAPLTRAELVAALETSGNEPMKWLARELTK